MKKIFFLFLLACCSLQAVAQEEMPSRKGKIFFIPELWLSFGSRTYIELGPLVGYHVNDRLSVGLGPHYIYQSQRATPSYPFAYETHTFGLKSFARFALITNAEQFLPIKLFNDLFVHVEYEALSLDASYYGPPNTEKDRVFYHALLVGGGFNQRVGMYNSVSFMVLWDVNGTSSSPYSNPIFRVGFNTFF